MSRRKHEINETRARLAANTERAMAQYDVEEAQIVQEERERRGVRRMMKWSSLAVLAIGAALAALYFWGYFT